MSKTDTHRPFKVQASDYPRAEHDHSKGECDLPTLEAWRRMGRRQDWKYNCCWQPSNWPTYKGFGRNKGEGEWIARSKNRKNKDWKDNYDY